MRQFILNKAWQHPTQRLITLSAILLLIWFSLSYAHAVTTMQPYTATYKIKALGIPVGKSIQHLRTNNGLYILSSMTHLRVAFIDYQLELKSYGHFTDDSVTPDKFYFNRESNNHQRGWELHFNQGQTQAKIIDYDSKKPDQNIQRQYVIKSMSEHPIQDGASQQLQVRFDLANFAGQTLHYENAGRKEMTSRIYRIVGTETIKTGIGEINTLKIEYEENGAISYAWLAPELNYLLVKVNYHAINYIQGTAVIDTLEFFEDGE